jgi:hypothetical protein
MVHSLSNYWDLFLVLEETTRHRELAYTKMNGISDPNLRRNNIVPHPLFCWLGSIPQNPKRYSLAILIDHLRISRLPWICNWFPLVRILSTVCGDGESSREGDLQMTRYLRGRLDDSAWNLIFNKTKKNALNPFSFFYLLYDTRSTRLLPITL